MANVLDMSGDALPNLHQWLPLLSESLAHQGRFRWQMRGASMLPTLPPDCEIEIVPPPVAIPLGALVVFAGNASLVVHRLVHRTPSRLLTQGDNRRGPDAWLQPSQVLGVVVAAYYDTRRIWPRAAEPVLRWWWIGRADGMWLLRRSKRLLFRR